jgi:predicted SAM-dependent methyltransferase
MNGYRAMKLHLGCGRVAPTDWVNIDYSWNARLAKVRGLRELLRRMGVLPGELTEIEWSRRVMIHDLRKPLPFRDGSARYIYSSHCVEHLTREDARRLLGECNRVLDRNGVIRLVVPDLLQLAENYLRAHATRPEGAAEEFLLDLTVFPERVESNPLLRLYRNLHDSQHKWMYDEALLVRCLRESGFTDIERRGYCESAIEDIAVLDVAERFVKSLCLEGRK